MKTKRLNQLLAVIFIMILAFCMLAITPVKADTEKGFAVTGGTEGTDYVYEDGVLTILKNGDYTISMAEGVSETSDRIKLNNAGELSSLTLTLNSINAAATMIGHPDAEGITHHLVETDFNSMVPLYFNLILNGDNVFTSDNEPFYFPRNIVDFAIDGDGSLALEQTVGTGGSVNGHSITLNSGTVTLNNMQLRTSSGPISVNGGTLNINSPEEAIYTNTGYFQTGGTANLTGRTIGIYVTGVSAPEPTDALEITGGDLSINVLDNTNSFGIYVGLRSQKNISVNTTGSVHITCPYIGIVLVNNSSLTMNDGTLKIDDPLIGIYAMSAGSKFNVNGGETEITSALRAIDLRVADSKDIIYSEDYFHKNYAGEEAASREEVSDDDVIGSNAVSKKYVLITPAWKITYDLAGGALPEGADNPVKYTRADEYKLVNPVGSKPFIGWTGTDLENPTMEVTIPEGSKGDRIYTANYESEPEPEEFTVTYDPNGGTIDGSFDKKVEIYKDGTTITIANAPKRDGYTFKNWSDSENNTYVPGDSYTVSSDIEFTAVWEKNSSEGSNDKSTPVPTGDDNSILLITVIMLLSLIAILLLLTMRQRSHKK